MWRGDFFYKRSIFEVKKGFRSSLSKAKVFCILNPSASVTLFEHCRDKITFPDDSVLGNNCFSVYSGVFDLTLLPFKSMAELPLRSL